MNATTSNDQRRRGPQGTVQQRVFLYLREHGPQPAGVVGRALDMRPDGVRRACSYMVERGIVERLEVEGSVLFGARPKCKPPRDLRGTRKTSRNHRGPVAFASWLLMMQRKHGAAWRYRPRHATALEALWPCR